MAEPTAPAPKSDEDKDEFGPRAPSMPQYFLGYAVVFGGVIALALMLVLLMHLMR